LGKVFRHGCPLSPTLVMGNACSGDGNGRIAVQPDHKPGPKRPGPKRPDLPPTNPTGRVLVGSVGATPTHEVGMKGPGPRRTASRKRGAPTATGENDERTTPSSGDDAEYDHGGAGGEGENNELSLEHYASEEGWSQEQQQGQQPQQTSSMPGNPPPPKAMPMLVSGGGGLLAAARASGTAQPRFVPPCLASTLPQHLSTILHPSFSLISPLCAARTPARPSWRCVCVGVCVCVFLLLCGIWLRAVSSPHWAPWTTVHSFFVSPCIILPCLPFLRVCFHMV
jgi:hypothetical protein